MECRFFFAASTIKSGTSTTSVWQFERHFYAACACTSDGCHRDVFHPHETVHEEAKTTFGQLDPLA